MRLKPQLTGQFQNPVRNIYFNIFSALFLLFVVSDNIFAQSKLKYDVVIYGGSASGVISAVAAASEGVSVAIFEPGKHLGGLVSGGLSHTDFGDRTIIGGLALEFNKKVADYYKKPVFYWRGAEPHVAEKIFNDWLAEKKVQVFFNCRLDTVYALDKHIQKMTFLNGISVVGIQFIDATYEGDLLAKAGVSYATGRESVKHYNESWAGRLPVFPGHHNFAIPISPFKDKSNKELIPLINPIPPVEIGEADKGIQAYGFRLTITNDPMNKIQISRPLNYDSTKYELVKRFIAKSARNIAIPYLMNLYPNIPNSKCDVNSIGPVSTNVLDGSNWDYPEGSYALRDKIWKDHLSYTQGFLYFLSTDSSVPSYIRNEFARWGLCKDEFTDNGGWPNQLYVREARRMVGEYVMTQKDLEKETVKYDAIGMGAYNIDIREVQRSWWWISRYPTLSPEIYNEGYLSVPVPPYEIPFRSLVPKYNECQNLIVPVCLSASHVAFGSLRMETQFMIMGHAAGIASATAVIAKMPIQVIPIMDLQSKLKKGNQILSLEQYPAGAFENENEIILDNDMSRFVSTEGDWISDEAAEDQHLITMDVKNRYAFNCLFNKNRTGSVCYTPMLSKSGIYRVSVWYPDNQANSTRTSVFVKDQKGTHSQVVNQSINGGKWNDLGRFSFIKGNSNKIIICADGANGVVIADAIKLERISN